MLNHIGNIDCLKGLKAVRDNSINLAIVDAPYGDDSFYGRMQKEIQGNESPLLNCSVLFELQRIMKDNTLIYNFTNWVHYPFLTEFIIRYTFFNIRQLIVCVKKNIGLGYGFRNQYELIIVLEKGKPTYNFFDFSNILDFDFIQHNENTHPHQKPESLIRKLVLHSSKEGDIILDPFVGSGTTAVVCKQLNRNFLGFEIDSKYCEMANKRLTQGNLSNILNKGKVTNKATINPATE